MLKARQDEFGWSPGCATKEEAKFWDKYPKILNHKSDQGDGDNAIALREGYLRTGIERFKRIPPNISEQHRELCVKFFTPQDKVKLIGKPKPQVKPIEFNDNMEDMHKFDEYLRTGENVAFYPYKFDEHNPPDRMPHHRLIVPDLYSDDSEPKLKKVRNLLNYLAMFAHFDYVWQKYIYKEGDGRALRFFWLVDEQILTVECCRFGPKAKSGKIKKDRCGKVREHTTARGLTNWNYVMKTNGRKRDPNFGPMTPQGYPERRAKCLLVLPPERQITYQPQKGIE